VDDIKKDPVKIGRRTMNWIGLKDMNKWRALVKAVEPSRSIKFWENFDWLHSWWSLG
jgi:hypothetical protein